MTNNARLRRGLLVVSAIALVGATSTAIAGDLRAGLMIGVVALAFMVAALNMKASG